MKKLLFFYLVLLAFVANGQNYRCLQPGVKNFFVNSDGYLRGIRIDSVRTYADSTVFYPYRTPRGPYGSPIAPYGMHIIDTNGGSWLGKKVIELSDGTTVFDGLWGDSVILKTQAEVGDSWAMYNDSGSIYYTATVTNKDTQTILSTLDSVKYLRINAFNNMGPLTSDPLNNSIIALSKNHGFTQTLDLYTFPYHEPDSIYRAGIDYFLDRPMNMYHKPTFFNLNKMTFNIIDFINPNDQQLYNWDVGTAIGSQQTCGNLAGIGYDVENLINYVVSKSTTGHIVSYTLGGTTATMSCPTSWTYPNIFIGNAGTKSFNDTNYSILSPYNVPEDRYSAHFIFYFAQDSFCYAGPAYRLLPIFYTEGLGGYTSTFNFKLGVGLTGHNYADGEPTWESSTLVWFKSNTITCGTPVAVNNIAFSETEFSISPNPATDELTIKAENLSGQYAITLQNLLGQTVYTTQATRSEEVIKVRDLPAGTYIVNITDEQGGRSSQKVMIQH